MASFRWGWILQTMIIQATKNAANQKSEAKFQTGSIFEFSPQEKYDVISAMGFIEYISGSVR